MTELSEFSFLSGSSSETVRRGGTLGACLAAGSVVGLTGDLGAGKTCFIKGIAAGLNNTPESDVTSPTFTILQEYPGPVPLYHFDAYRLSGSADLEAIGFEDYVSGDGVAVMLSGNGELNGRKEQLLRFALRITPLAAGELSLDGLQVVLALQVKEERRDGFSFFSS